MTEAVEACDGLDNLAPCPGAEALPPDVPALKVFYLYLSAGCNLHCRHCWITPTFVHGKPVPAECLDFDLLKSAVAEAKPMGLAAAKLTGGEPTLHPEFRKIADFLTAEGLDISMETNATLIDRELAVHLREKTSLKRIAVSLDSPDASEHDRFRGVKGAHGDAVRGIGHLVAAGIRPQIIMSVYRGNLGRIEALIADAVTKDYRARERALSDIRREKSDRDAEREQALSMLEADSERIAELLERGAPRYFDG